MIITIKINISASSERKYKTVNDCGDCQYDISSGVKCRHSKQRTVHLSNELTQSQELHPLLSNKLYLRASLCRKTVFYYGNIQNVNALEAREWVDEK